MHSKIPLFVGALLLALHSIAFALPGDRDKPIQIDADSAQRSEKTGVTSYIGSVELTQGSLNILADRIDIYTLNGQVDHAIATGKRAYFTQQQSLEKEPVKAWALTIKYFINEEAINLIGDARIEQNGSTVNSPEIDYYADQELVKAKGGEQGSNERVHVTLPPQKKSDVTNTINPNTSPTATSDAITSDNNISDPDITDSNKLIEAAEPIITDASEKIKALPETTQETP
jgi:lipopolysaccharide export system protein LptA